MHSGRIFNLLLSVLGASPQASSQSMPWLADLVQSSEGSLDVLPVQCLCEFLLHDAADDNFPTEDEDEAESKEQRAKKRQVCNSSPRSSVIFVFSFCSFIFVMMLNIKDFLEMTESIENKKIFTVTDYI